MAYGKKPDRAYRYTPLSGSIDIPAKRAVIRSTRPPIEVDYGRRLNGRRDQDISSHSGISGQAEDRPPKRDGGPESRRDAVALDRRRYPPRRPARYAEARGEGIPRDVRRL